MRIRKQAFDLNEAILGVTALTHSEAVKSGITVRMELAPHLPRVKGDRVQLQQVVLNLIVNAIQAMSNLSDGVRELHISTDSVQSEGVCVRVRDTGPGLSPENLGRLFEPFYTTKPDGMGIGLSICRSIIEAHGGGCGPAPMSPAARCSISRCHPIWTMQTRGWGRPMGALLVEAPATPRPFRPSRQQATSAVHRQLPSSRLSQFELAPVFRLRPHAPFFLGHLVVEPLANSDGALAHGRVRLVGSTGRN
jgi:hypothetical protein